MTQQPQPATAEAAAGPPEPRRSLVEAIRADLKVTWSTPAAARAIRAMIIVPGLFALGLKVIGNEQFTVFATFGAVGTLVLTTFGGSRRDKAVAHFGLAVAGSLTLIIGTLVSGSIWLAALATIPVTFAVCFAAVAGPNAASGVTGALLAYVLPVATSGGAGLIPSRLAGWLLASAVSTAAVLLLSPRSPGDQLRALASAAADAQARHLTAALAGTATQTEVDASRQAKQNLMNKFASTPYRPTGLATTDQALASVVHMLEWSAGLSCDALNSHLDLSAAAPQDKHVLAESAKALRGVSDLLSDRNTTVDLPAIWHARAASAALMCGLTGDHDRLYTGVSYAYHAQSIGLAASAAAADAMIAAGRADRAFVAQQRRHWVDGLPHSDDEPVQQRRDRFATSLAALLKADASRRSVWFRNSARAAIALAGAVAVARLTGVQHGFWVVLGTLSVLRTSAASTGATAARALGGTAVGFIIGGALLIGIGTTQEALWAAFPIAVLIAAYAPGTMPFAAGQAAFTVTVVVLFNLLIPAGWEVGLIRIEDVALGCAVSVVVGLLFWPRGAAAVVGDNLADALLAGAHYLTDATRWALDLGRRRPSDANRAIAAGTRLDEAVRGYLTEQGTKRMPKAELWLLVMAVQRIRLTAHSLSSLPVHARAHHHQREQDGVYRSAKDTGLPRGEHRPVHVDLSEFYEQLAVQVGSPGHGPAALAEVPLPASLAGLNAHPGPDGSVSFAPEHLWVRMHLEQLSAHAAGLSAPAAHVARLRRVAWWRPQPGEETRAPVRRTVA